MAIRWVGSWSTPTARTSAVSTPTRGSGTPRGPPTARASRSWAGAARPRQASLDIFWLRDESLEDVENLSPPAIIAAEIVEDLEAALAEFSLIAETLGGEVEAE
jgi:hypothetical protein